MNVETINKESDMSCCACDSCGDIIDTDFQLDSIDGKCVCDDCFEMHEEKEEEAKNGTEVSRV
jgi:hypothetical protein